MATLTKNLSSERGSGAERCLRDPSFSSYLSGTEECYVINLAKKSLGPGDVEIDVFSAEKYFNESLDDEKPEVIKLPPVQDMVSCAKTKALSGASSVCSVSSWNSQSALLNRELRNPSVNGASRVKTRSYLGSFRCRCMCTDNNSVAVDEYQSRTQSAAKEPVKRVVSPITAERQCMSANQGLNRETYSSSSKDLSLEDLAMKPRKSLEVFGTPLLQTGNKPFSFEMERKLTSRPAEIVTAGAYAESDSDSSSDLFEIEDFTTKANPFPTIKNMSDSTAYAPSEASIEWSVVTASAADFPITSDYDELTTINKKTASKEMDQKATAATSDKPRPLSSSFLACNSQSSVNVVNHEKKAERKIRKSQQDSNSAQTEAKLLTARNMHIGTSSRSLGQSKSLHGLYFL